MLVRLRQLFSLPAFAFWDYLLLLSIATDATWIPATWILSSPSPHPVHSILIGLNTSLRLHSDPGWEFQNRVDCLQSSVSGWKEAATSMTFLNEVFHDRNHLLQCCSSWSSQALGEAGTCCLFLCSLLETRDSMNKVAAFLIEELVFFLMDLGHNDSKSLCFSWKAVIFKVALPTSLHT